MNYSVSQVVYAVVQILVYHRHHYHQRSVSPLVVLAITVVNMDALDELELGLLIHFE